MCTTNHDSLSNFPIRLKWLVVCILFSNAIIEAIIRGQIESLIVWLYFKTSIQLMSTMIIYSKNSRKIDKDVLEISNSENLIELKFF